MQILDNELPILLWAAERAFSFQLLAGFYRLGLDVTALVSDAKAREYVSKIYPKCKEGLSVPSSFQGNIVWAPNKELFGNHVLAPAKLEEARNLAASASAEIHVYLLLPQNAQTQVLQFVKSPFLHKIYFPALVGFGDENIFDKSLDAFLKRGALKSQLVGNFLSVFDAISFVLTILKTKNFPESLWVRGHPLLQNDINAGFEQATESSKPHLLKHFISKLVAVTPHFNYQQSIECADSKILMAEDFFPTRVTPWQRFFRDAYRNYVSTPEGSHLLHFKATRAP